MTTSHADFDTPIGPMYVVVTDGEVVRISLRGQRHLPTRTDDGSRDDGVGRDVQHQLAEYFTGRRRAFDLALGPRGTDFQMSLWRELAAIPYGETVSYSELARRIGRPRSVRAVAMANARNPFTIVYPCHRVVGVDGSLTGYAGGLDVKRRLLELEGVPVLAGERVRVGQCDAVV